MTVHRLRDLTVRFGSLVDKGAGQDVRVLLFKRDYSTDQRDQMAQAGEAMPDGSFPIANTADLKNAIQSIGRAKDRAAAMAHIKRRAKALGAMDMLPPDWMGKRDDDAAVSALIDAAAQVEKVGRKMAAPRMAALKVAIEQLNQILSEVAASNCAEPDTDEETPMSKKDEPTVEALSATVAELQKALGERDAKIVELEKAATPAPTEDDILKSLPQAVRERIEKAEADAKSASEVAKAERDARLNNEYIAKAAKFSALSQDANKLGPILKRAHGGEPLTADDCAELERILTAANEAVSKSKVFGEIGKTGADDDASATSRVMKLAEDLVKDGKATNVPDAIAKMSTDPAHRQLMGDYVAESRARH